MEYMQDPENETYRTIYQQAEAGNLEPLQGVIIEALANPGTELARQVELLGLRVAIHGVLTGGEMGLDALRGKIAAMSGGNEALAVAQNVQDIHGDLRVLGKNIQTATQEVIGAPSDDEALAGQKTTNKLQEATALAMQAKASDYLVPFLKNFGTEQHDARWFRENAAELADRTVSTLYQSGRTLRELVHDMHEGHISPEEAWQGSLDSWSTAEDRARTTISAAKQWLDNGR